jgi:hypothetical protein
VPNVVASSPESVSGLDDGGCQPAASTLHVRKEKAPGPPPLAGWRPPRASPYFDLDQCLDDGKLKRDSWMLADGIYYKPQPMVDTGAGTLIVAPPSVEDAHRVEKELARHVRVASLPLDCPIGCCRRCSALALRPMRNPYDIIVTHVAARKATWTRSTRLPLDCSIGCGCSCSAGALRLMPQ